MSASADTVNFKNILLPQSGKKKLRVKITLNQKSSITISRPNFTFCVAAMRQRKKFLLHYYSITVRKICQPYQRRHFNQINAAVIIVFALLAGIIRRIREYPCDCRRSRARTGKQARQTLSNLRALRCPKQSPMSPQSLRRHPF